ncbi:ubiquitin-protein ligase [Vararia minispora EC-137]|uniref:Ubiquitin-protein ligase n=1 Tax=Vararia minispora EC-137 TaxID=1314806 RepID=A0ACB8QL34_9AGAM|nr:ubiquitin-protein ligase [Vararia minispora EC-137]
MASAALRNQVATKWQDAFNRLNRGQPGISGLMGFSEAWSVASEFLYPKDLGDPPKDFNVQHVKAAFDVLIQCRTLPMLLENFVETMRQRQYLITRDVEAFMAEYENSNDPGIIAKLTLRLCEWYAAWAPLVELGQTISAAYVAHFQTHVFSVLPPTFAGGFKALISATLAAFTDPESVPDAALVQDPNLWQCFETLGLTERYEALISSVCYEHIENHVTGMCAGKWDEQMLSKLREWMADKVVPWMLLPYARGAKTAEEARAMLQGVGSRFDFHVCKTLCDLRTKELFDIIIDYPESAAALQDLKECLQRVDQRSQLVQSLRKANKRRLLHPGADTKDILTQYVSIIRCLRIVDPPGVLLYKVAEPIRRYLRERPDTIRCIVASLVGDGESGDSLVDDNEPIQPLQGPQVDDYMDPNWDPEPIDAGPDFRANKPSDVISTLVSIYDSKDLFVKELQVLLAQRLLAVADGNYDNERRNIEILKIRFGEGPLQVCEVMLKDMTDSRRIDQHVQQQNPSILHPTIISRHFWPSLQSSKLTMPGQFKKIQDIYAKEYTAFKPDKRLRWLPHLGTVQLKLELQDRTLNTWTLDELMSRVGLTERTASLKALFAWVDRGVLHEESSENFRLLEQAEASTVPRGAAHRPIIEDEPMASTVAQEQAAQMRVYWRFIEGMLTNLGQLPIERIQSMLKFAPGYDQTQEQLAAFLEAAQREGLVTFSQGCWKLHR